MIRPMVRIGFSLCVALSLFATSRLRAEEPAALTLYPRPGEPAGEVRGNGELKIAQRDANATWNLFKFDSVYFTIKNPTDQRITVRARAENPFAHGVFENVRTAGLVEPGQTATVRLRLMRRPQDPTYTPFKPFFMYFSDLNVRDNTVDPSYIARLFVWIENGTKDQRVIVESVVAQGDGNQEPVPFFPFIDKYGQYKHTDWPDKIRSDDDFAAVVKRDQLEMAAHPGPESWDKWGGWKDGPLQKATGFFYPIKVDGKWWLVDPDGALFWSYAPTGVNAGGEGSPVTGKETWFEEMPAPDGPYAKYWTEGQGARFRYYADGKAWKAFSFSALNAERKYGPDWRNATADALHARLRNWGFNSMGNWSDPVVYLKHKTPYTVAIVSGEWSLDHMPDVFDPKWVASVNAALDKEKDTTANDPWNIGYFIDNELTWGGSPRGLRVTQGILQKGEATSSSKIAFIEDLKAKYSEIEKLNKAWATHFESWDALLQSKAGIAPENDAYRKDAGDFGEKFIHKYFATCRDAVQRVAPNNLYLGCRFHGHIDRSIMTIAGQYCDVISYNWYDMPRSRFDQYLNVVDKPFLVGEFGVTSDLGQTPWRGKIFTEPDGDRLKSMEAWLNEGLAHPSLVGAHFFQFRDQPVSGRPDGEATLRGFLNVADAPHFDLVQLNRRIAYKMYETRSKATARRGTGG